MSDLSLGVARARLGPSAALLHPQRGAAACEENRLTRGRQAPTSGAPHLAIAELLTHMQLTTADVNRIAVVREANDPEWWSTVVEDRALLHGRDLVQIEAHEAHAEYAARSSGFGDALVVVCDGLGRDGWSAWHYSTGTAPRRLTAAAGHFPLARVYGELTAGLGFQPSRDEYLVESMARAGDDAPSAPSERVVIGTNGIETPADFQQLVRDAWAGGVDPDRARRNVAASVQRRLAEALTELLSRLRRDADASRVCLTGGLFFNTHFTTVAACAAGFDETHIPPHPGRTGSAMGAALALAGPAGVPANGVASPYLGPGYDEMQVKQALENCKLSFDLQHEGRVRETVLGAIQRGRLVGWFHGRLEWGPRALGHRTVLADPLAPHVLDNLSGFLKKRPWYRSYGVSVPEARLEEFFEPAVATTGSPRGAATSPFMQFEYRPRDPEKFRTVLPPGVRTLRVHTVNDREPRFLRLLEAWGEMSGVPVLVNTSFNGFHEPLVCSPRDAIRVFYGTGLDLLAIEDFVLRK